MHCLKKDGMMDFRYPPGLHRLVSLALTCGVVLLSLTGSGCQTAYYETMEKLGYHKRDLMVSDVKKARDAQQDAKEYSSRGLIASPKREGRQGQVMRSHISILDATTRTSTGISSLLDSFSQTRIAARSVSGTSSKNPIVRLYRGTPTKPEFRES